MACLVDPVTGKKTFQRDYRSLTKRQRELVEAYDGNVSAAIAKTGYSRNAVYKLLRDPRFIQALEIKAGRLAHEVSGEFVDSFKHVVIENARLVAGAIAAREDRQAFWTKVMLDEEQNMAFRLKAAELLGKAQGDFIERHEHAGVVMMVVNPYDEQKAAPVIEAQAREVREDAEVEATLAPEDPYASAP